MTVGIYQGKSRNVGAPRFREGFDAKGENYGYLVSR